MDKKNLPVFGVGPIYVIFCMIITVVGLILSKSEWFEKGNFPALTPFSNIVGGLFIIAGCILWIWAVLIQKISKEIKKGELVTSGVYSIVRNPVYSAFLSVFTGMLITAHNLYLLILPVLFYLLLTVLMKRTEEKWLLQKFGKKYADYCSHVNRCIPWFPKKTG